MPTFCTAMRNHSEVEKAYTECEPFSKDVKSVKCFPLVDLKVALSTGFNQASLCNSEVSSSFLKDNLLCLADRIGVHNFTASSG